jgi:hypothetical protein
MVFSGIQKLICSFCWQLRADLCQLHSLSKQPAHYDVEDRREDKTEPGNAEHAEEDGGAERLAHFSAGAGGDRQGLWCPSGSPPKMRSSLSSSHARPRTKARIRFDAAAQAARTRLRPILMTSFAFIFGVVPRARAGLAEHGTARAGDRNAGAGAGGRIGFVGQNSRRERDSLISAEISLIADLNSLQGHKKFPVPVRRELARKPLVQRAFLVPLMRRRAQNRWNSLLIPC